MELTKRFLLLIICYALSLVAGNEVVNIKFTQIITCTYTAYLGSTSAFDTTLKQTIAGTTGVSTADLSNYAVTSSSPNIQVAYDIVVTNAVNTYAQITTQLIDEVADKTFDNLLHIFAAANSATALTTATAGAYTITSQQPTAAPSPTPTSAPTEYSAEHFGWQVRHYWIYATIIGSFVGAFVLYHMAWGVVYLLEYLAEQQKRHQAELMDKVDKANAKLTRKFVKHMDSPSPHASKMRANFEKQFGYAPTNTGKQGMVPGVEEGMTLSGQGGAGSRGAAAGPSSPRSKARDMPQPRNRWDETKDLEAAEATPPKSPQSDLSAHSRTTVSPGAGKLFGTKEKERVDDPHGKANRLRSNEKYVSIGAKNREKFGFDED